MALPHILLVDTPEGVLAHSAGLLEGAGFLVSAATGARDALNRLVADGHHDLILLHSAAVDMDRIDFLRDMKQCTEALALIVVSDDLSF